MQASHLTPHFCATCRPAQICSASGSDEPPVSPPASELADEMTSCTCDPPVDDCSTCAAPSTAIDATLCAFSPSLHHQKQQQLLSSSCAPADQADQPLDLSLHSRHKPSIVTVARTSLSAAAAAARASPLAKGAASLLRVPQLATT